MPYVNVKVTEGVSRPQKRQLVRDITDSLMHVLGKQPEHIHIVIDEVPEENWGYEGMLTDEWKAQRAKTTPTNAE